MCHISNTQVCALSSRMKSHILTRQKFTVWPDLFLIYFNAGPRSKTTHWKQTVLYLEDVLTICEGEALVGSMSVEPNKKNPRDIDIMLKYSLNGRRCQVSRTQYYKMRWPHTTWMSSGCSLTVQLGTVFFFFNAIYERPFWGILLN